MTIDEKTATLEKVMRPDGSHTVYAPLLDGTWSAVLYTADGAVIRYGRAHSHAAAKSWADEQWAKKGKQS